LKIDTHILNQYLDHQLSEEEVRNLETVLDTNLELRSELELLRNINSCSLEFSEIENVDIEATWNEFSSRIETPVIEIKKNFSWVKLTAAAAILIFSGLFFYNSFFNHKVDQIAKTNELFILPDGSELIMSSGSKISFNEKNYLSDRSVFLVGDVLFRVKSNKKNPFFLFTSNSKIQVTGTKFRVFSNKENTSVSLFEGELLIQSDKKTIYLKPGENATCVEGELLKNNSKLSDNSIEWFSLDFESISFSEIVKNLERRFDVNIKYPQHIKNQKFTIKAEGLKLEEILSILTELTNTSVITNGRFIELKP